MHSTARHSMALHFEDVMLLMQRVPALACSSSSIKLQAAWRTSCRLSLRRSTCKIAVCCACSMLHSAQPKCAAEPHGDCNRPVSPGSCICIVRTHSACARAHHMRQQGLDIGPHHVTIGGCNGLPAVEQLEGNLHVWWCSMTCCPALTLSL